MNYHNLRAFRRLGTRLSIIVGHSQQAWIWILKQTSNKDVKGGLVVRLLAFNSGDLSSIPAEA